MMIPRGGSADGNDRRRGGRRGARVTVAVLALAGLAVIGGVTASSPRAAEDGKAIYKKANCIGCHKWHGEGGGGYGGLALSLRKTELDRAMLIETIRCGRPATGMPYHDREAWADQGCFGVAKEDLGSDAPPPAAKFLRPAEIDAVADYVLTVLKGHGSPTKADCVAFWGEGARECASYR